MKYQRDNKTDCIKQNCLDFADCVPGKTEADSVKVDGLVSHKNISKEEQAFVDGIIELWPLLRKGTRRDVLKKLGEKKPPVLAEFMYQFING